MRGCSLIHLLFFGLVPRVVVTLIWIFAEKCHGDSPNGATVRSRVNQSLGRATRPPFGESAQLDRRDGSRNKQHHTRNTPYYLQATHPCYTHTIIPETGLAYSIITQNNTWRSSLRVFALCFCLVFCFRAPLLLLKANPNSVYMHIHAYR